MNDYFILLFAVGLVIALICLAIATIAIELAKHPDVLYAIIFALLAALLFREIDGIDKANFTHEITLAWQELSSDSATLWGFCSGLSPIALWLLLKLLRKQSYPPSKVASSLWDLRDRTWEDSDAIATASMPDLRNRLQGEADHN